MKCGLLPISHDALLVGDMVYFDYNGDMEEEADRIDLQKCLGPTCKVRVEKGYSVILFLGYLLKIVPTNYSSKHTIN